MNNNDKIQNERDYWNVDKSVKRLIWRLAPNEKGQTFQFKPNESDFKALKSVLGALDREKNKSALEYPYFTKLLIVQLIQNARYYETTFLDKFPTRDIFARLDTPFDVLVQELHSTIHNNLINKMTLENSDEVINQYKQLQESFTYDYFREKIRNVSHQVLTKTKAKE